MPITDFNNINFGVKPKDIRGIEQALLSNIAFELERIGKYLKILCETQDKEQRCSEKQT